MHKTAYKNLASHEIPDPIQDPLTSLSLSLCLSVCRSLSLSVALCLCLSLCLSLSLSPPPLCDCEMNILSCFVEQLAAIPSKPTLTAQPASFTIGDAVNLLCQTTSTGSSLTFSWQKSGVSLSETSSQLSIASYDNSNTGVYTCTARTSSLASLVSDSLELQPSGKCCLSRLIQSTFTRCKITSADQYI